MQHIVIPGLLDKPTNINSPGPSLRLPQLEVLLGKADKISAPANYVETVFDLYAIAYNAARDLPTAAICYYADAGAQTPTHDYLLHADPIHLKPDQDRLLAFDFHHQPLTVAEAQQYAALFNQHFTRDGLQLLAPHPNRWYIAAKPDPDLQTSHLIDVIGRNIDLFLPQGQDAAQWLSWMNEIQMLLHTALVNKQRESYTQLPVSGLWFSGGGRLPKTVGAGFTHVDGDCVLIQGLQAIAKQKKDAYLRVEHAPGRAMVNNDSAAWLDALQQIDAKFSEWMQDEFMLYPCNGSAWHWRPGMQRRWWRRKQTIL